MNDELRVDSVCGVSVVALVLLAYMPPRAGVYYESHASGNREFGSDELAAEAIFWQ